LISHKLNKVFKILMLFQLSWYFIKSVHACIDIYEVLVNRNQELWTFDYILEYLYDLTNFIQHSILFLTLNYVCQTVYCKVNETVAIFHKLSSYNLDEKLRELILQFILQIKLREVKFGEGYFYGYNLICQEMKMCLNEFSLVDDTMEAVGSPKKYQCLRKWIIRIIFGHIVHRFLQIACMIFIDNDINMNFLIIVHICLFDSTEFVHISSALIWGTILGLVLYYEHLFCKLFLVDSVCQNVYNLCKFI
ncbi:hypothetical protein ALC56_06644, partial [Trachymyrmex septentrionalis]